MVSSTLERLDAHCRTPQSQNAAVVGLLRAYPIQRFRTGDVRAIG